MPLKNAFFAAALAFRRRLSSSIRFEEECTNEYETEKEMELSPAIVVTGADYDVSGKTAATVLTIATAAAASTTNNRFKLRHVQCVNERRRSFEDNLAAIFMGFVLVFLVCHMPRLLLNIHELVVMKGAMECRNQNHEPFSLWSLILISVSHFLLVLNSGTNILVYCFMSTKFRKECSKFYRSLSNSICCNARNNTPASNARRANTLPIVANETKYINKYLTVPTRSSPLPSSSNV